MQAAYSGNVEMVRMLLEVGAGVNFVTVDNEEVAHTALCHAVSNCEKVHRVPLSPDMYYCFNTCIRPIDQGILATTLLPTYTPKTNKCSYLRPARGYVWARVLGPTTSHLRAPNTKIYCFVSV